MPQLDNPMHERLALEYVALGCRKTAASEAARAVGFSGSMTAVYTLLHHPAMQERIRELTGEIFIELGITAKRTFGEIARIAYADPGEMFDASGNMLPLHKMAPEVRAMISSMDFETTMRGRGDDAYPVHTVKVRLWNKLEALSILARHFKIVDNDKQGLDALAGQLATMLREGRTRAQAHRRASLDNVSDAAIIEPETPASRARALPAAVPSRVMLPPEQEIDDEERIW
ncbi:MAG: terminase small subunit [Burkholderiales bacterium]